MSKVYLDEIIDYKRKVVKERKEFYASIKEKLSQAEYSSYHLFHKQISVPGPINLIAEIKKASPSRGLILKDFDLLEIARTYVEHKAAAISVLTEDKYFLGNPGYVKKVSDSCDVPVLTKDFIIDEGQIYEARFNGASAVLLIVAILSGQELKNLIEVASVLDMDCLVEVHDEEEIKKALDSGAEIIGINNRNLHTFEVDVNTAQRLIPCIPRKKVIVVESGLSAHEEIQRLEDLGVHAVLIGEAFMKADDIGEKIDEVMGT